MKTLVILLGEHPCIVNILFGPITVHYREVLLYLFAAQSVSLSPSSVPRPRWPHSYSDVYRSHWPSLGVYGAPWSHAQASR